MRIDVVPAGEVPEHGQEFGRRGDHAHGAHDRLDDDGGEVVLVLFEDAEGGLGLVEGKDDRSFEDAAGETGATGHRNGAVGVAGFGGVDAQAD